jgi:hypothetical protein
MQDDQFDCFSAENVGEFPGSFHPVAMRSMSCVAQARIDGFDIVLIPRQYGDRNSVFVGQIMCPEIPSVGDARQIL